VRKLKPAVLTLFYLSIFLFNSCTGLDFKFEPVSFVSPAEILQIKEVQPTEQELQGIVLRIQPPASGQSTAEERLKIYSRLKDSQGMSLDLYQKITMIFKPVPGKNSFVQKTTSVFDKGAGEITEEAEFSPRGEVLKYISGRHESQAGKFQVENLTRNPVYPQEPAKIGDQWTYEEYLKVKLESFWVKELNPTPYEMKSQSTLKGFAELAGRRCAVIETTSVQSKEMTLKVLFKTITADIRTTIQETEYLDYAKEEIVGRVTLTTTDSSFPGTDIQDHGQSQSIYRLLS
jgi:hypothetical protein